MKQTHRNFNSRFFAKKFLSIVCIKILKYSSLLSLFIVVTQSAQARIEGRFLGPNYFITLVSNNSDGTSDGTPQAIYRAMAAEPVSGALGFTKSLRLPEEGLQFGCSLKGDGNYQCTFMVKNSASSRISLQGASAQFKGDLAEKIFVQFRDIPAAGTQFIDQTEKLAIQVSPTNFNFHFKAR